MKFNLVNDYEEMSQQAAQLVIEEIKRKPNLVACFPTGGTPLRMYEILCEEYQQGHVDFSSVRVRSVDDYVGLPPEHDQSYYYYLHTLFFSKCNFDPKNIHLIDSCAEDMAVECENYKQLLMDDGGIDLLIDGIGENGHIGFNEPAAFLCDRFHVEEVSEWTTRVNARFFESINDVPKFAVTVGILDMLQAKKLIILSSGAKKATAWNRVLRDSILTTNFPASFLKLAENVVVILDKESVRDCEELIIKSV